ncbi:MAG: three-Cys-motif partner protein TcmP [Nocardioides sp.]
MPRLWGRWTQIKLEAIENYIRAFTTVAQRARVTLYLDLFGGRPQNFAREDLTSFRGSALRAALVTPPFSRIIVSELDASAAAEQATALSAFPGGRATVLVGDCNVVMPDALKALPQEFRFAPTFALIDQFSAEVQWETLRFLSEYKAPSARTKVELMMYFGGSFMVRGLRGPNGRVNQGYARRLDALYGNERWRMVLAAGDDGVLTPSDVQEELANTMRWQLEEELGYNDPAALDRQHQRDTNILDAVRYRSPGRSEDHESPVRGSG